jgi:hypothetical protein
VLAAASEGCECNSEPTYRRFGNAGKIGANNVVAVASGAERRKSILTHLAL